MLTYVGHDVAMVKLIARCESPHGYACFVETNICSNRTLEINCRNITVVPVSKVSMHHFKVIVHYTL
jgi:hypothetical protein